MKSNKTILWVIGLAAVIFLGTAAFLISNQEEESPTKETETATEQTPAKETATESTDNQIDRNQEEVTETEEKKYFDGTYSASSTYSSPAPDPETVFVEVTIKDGIVEDLLVTAESKTPVSTRYQELFTQGIEAEIVGKSLDTDSPTRVNGSSLTSVGFNKALESIRKQAEI